MKFSFTKNPESDFFFIKNPNLTMLPADSSEKYAQSKCKSLSHVH